MPFSNWIKTPIIAMAKYLVADDLNQALALQTQLESGQSIVTLDGYHVGRIG
jgi:chromosome segregation protein